MVRYPGGNFVSAYNWEDGIGPREQRPTRLDLAWHTSDSNAVGVHEFADWCDTVDTEMMLAVNLGSRGLDEARNFLEYVNGPTGSLLGRPAQEERPRRALRRQTLVPRQRDGRPLAGRPQDGRTNMAGSPTRWPRPCAPSTRTLELIVCGSSHSNMPTYPDWEREVLEHTYDNVDHISLHMYFANREKNTANYLALNEKLDRYIATVASTINFVKAKKRSKHDVYISFDEWNVWYHSNKQDRAILDGNAAGRMRRALLEDIYNFEDVLQVGLILNTFIRRSDVVKLACIAQLVNVIAPIMTDPKGAGLAADHLLPVLFRLGLRPRHGAAAGGQHRPATTPSMATMSAMSTSRASTTRRTGRSRFFAVNRHGSEAIDLDLSLEGFGAGTVIDHQVMTHQNLEAVNTATDQTNVAPCKGTGAKVEGKVLSVKLAPYSYQMIRVKV